MNVGRLKPGRTRNARGWVRALAIALVSLGLICAWAKGRGYWTRTVRIVWQQYRVPVHVHDLMVEGQEFPLGRELALRLNQRTVLGLPLLRKGEAIGCLFLRRTQVIPFSEKQIALLQTFANQAVIAIENTRLFEEVQARNRDLTALGEVGRVVSSTLDLKVVLKTIVDRAVHRKSAKDPLLVVNGMVDSYREVILMGWF